MNRLTQAAVTNEFGEYVGKTIASIRPMTDKEVRGLGWEVGYDDAFVIVFTDGSALIPSADQEGNGAGWLFTADVTPSK
jgi:hypothetical protein